MQENNNIEHLELDENFVADVLSPYKFRYLKKARVELNHAGSEAVESVKAIGQFSIKESCYIQDTGHFNAVEFNICYNQLVYVLIGYAIRNSKIEHLKHMDYAEFRRRQLPNILIANSQMKFKRQITSDFFEGQLRILKTFARKKVVYLNTFICFKDSAGGYSEGKILLAVTMD